MKILSSRQDDLHDQQIHKDEFSSLSSIEQNQILIQWNATQRDYPQNRGIHQLFELQVAQTPDAIAVASEDEQVTYAVLNRRAKHLAHHLRMSGVRVDVPVGVCLEHSCEQVSTFLAILMAGGAYVPLDPAYPQERLAFMLADTQIKIIVSQSQLCTQLPEQSAHVICLDQFFEQPISSPVTIPESMYLPEQLAYIMYTSGSTGQPKGIAIPHGAVVRLLFNTNYINLDTQDCVAWAANAAFDAATFEIWGALLHGGRLSIVPRAELLNPQLFVLLLHRQGITTLFLTTALFNQMARAVPHAFAHLKQLLIGGEAIDVQWVKAVLNHGGPQRFLHVYGPTESTTYATWYSVQNILDSAVTIPIGMPLSNTTCYVLDESLYPVPIGVVGELYIGGDGLARGYWQRSALTAERFLPHPFSTQPGARLYRTGDLVRYLSDGAIEYVGRLDQQVKIRGFRIEPGEIEFMLKKHTAIRDAVVLAREDQPGEKHLVAYLVPQQDQPLVKGDLRFFLQEHLPEYMIPATFVLLEALPLTLNGKVDRQRLPTPDWSDPERVEPFIAPRTPIEEVLAGIWAQLFGLKNISVDDNFFELGGHSLLATQCLTALREELQLELPFRSIFENPTIAGLAQFIEENSQYVRQQQIPAIQRTSRLKPLPLSFAQEGIWFVQQLDNASLSYNFQATIRFTGNLDQDILEKSLSEIIRRHEIFRTSFPEIDGQPVQVIHPPQDVRIPLLNLRNRPSAQREAEVQRLITEKIQEPFDLTQIPLVRWLLLQVDEQEYVLLHIEHHLIHDGWSFNTFLGEMIALYTAFAAGQASPLPELPIQFADYAFWQHQMMTGDIADTQLTYWKKQLHNASPSLNLPTDYARKAVQSFKGDVSRITLPPGLCEDLRAFSRQEGSTLFMTMFAAFLILLYRYSGQEDISVGSGIANRRWKETETLIGMIINTLVLRADLSGDPSFHELLRRVSKITLEAYAHQDLPFHKVVEALQPERRMGGNPLFQVMFSFHDSPMPDLNLPGLRLDLHTGLGNDSTKCDLNMIVIPQSEQYVGRSTHEEHRGIDIRWEYSTDLFTEATIGRMNEQFQVLLKAIISSPEQNISQLPLLNEVERQQVLLEWNATQAAIPPLCLHQLFEQQVTHTPDAIALVAGEEQVTYQQLNARADHLAARLQAQGIGVEDRVALCVPRSLYMIIGLLGILKAGAAFVPLDPESPTQRVRSLLASAQVKMVLAVHEVAPLLQAVEQSSVFPLFWLDEEPWQQDTLLTPTSHPQPPQTLASLMYTSGSTGQPKGTLIEHRNIVRLVHAANYITLDAEQVFLQAAPLTFDASTLEIWAPLLHGGRLVLFEAGPLDLLELARSLERDQISHLWCTASLFHQLVSEHLESLHGLRYLLAGGDVLSVLDVQRVLEQVPTCQLINGYGPTENTTFTSTAVLTPTTGLEPSVPIGRPIPNTQIYVLDPWLQPVPIGVPGELYTGGMGLSRGYLEQPELTAERFLPHPFSSQAGARLYRTGDLVRYRADGMLEFLGRVDQQIKLRGFRIEPGEIETALRRYPGIQEAVVVLRKERPETPYLAAYLVVNPELAAMQDVQETLRQFLQEQLPVYMIPSIFILLDTLPLTATGKVDRQALPLPEDIRTENEETYVAPRTPTEESLTLIWKEILGREQISVTDNFFKMGGHSLLATQILARIRNVFQAALPLRIIFEKPTVAEMASVIAQFQKEPQDIILKQSSRTQEEDDAARLLAKLDSLSEEDVNLLLREMLPEYGENN